VERELGQPLPHITWKKIAVLDTARYRDDDVMDKAGLRAPHDQKLAYPQVMYSKAPGAAAVPGMVVGDSYARGLFYLSTMDVVFGKGPFWYYNNSRVPDDPQGRELWELDLEQEIMRYKVVMVLCNEHNLKELGNGFISNAYRLFTDRARFQQEQRDLRPFRMARKAVRKDEALMREITEQGRNEGLPVDTVIDRAARKRLAVSSASAP
jgi:hypothetical protein